ERQRDASCSPDASSWLRAEVDVGSATTPSAAAKNADHGAPSEVAESDIRLSTREDRDESCDSRPSSPLLSTWRANTRPSASRCHAATCTPWPTQPLPSAWLGRAARSTRWRL